MERRKREREWGGHEVDSAVPQDLVPKELVVLTFLRADLLSYRH